MWYSIESGPPAPINRNIFNSLEDISILGQFIKYLCTYLTHSSIVEIRIPDLNVRQASYTSSLYSYIQYIPLWGWGGKSERWCEIAQVPLSLSSRDSPCPPRYLHLLPTAYLQHESRHLSVHHSLDLPAAPWVFPTLSSIFPQDCEITLNSLSVTLNT